MTYPPRRLFHWKFVFYVLLLPLLRSLGPRRCDAALGALGWLAAILWPGRKKRLIKAVATAREALDLDASTDCLWPELAAATARFLARDCALDGQTDQNVMSRFDVQGYGELLRVLEQGQGAVLVGSHMGAYIAGLHWLFRVGIPVRALVQRPTHVSAALSRLFDQAQGPFPQSGLFLQRDLPRADSINVLNRARRALRTGHALYLCGDIPWDGPNSRPGRVLGVRQPYLSIWTELAVLARVPVFHVFCTHLPGGRFRLEIDNVGLIQPGEQTEAVADFLKQLEARIASHPAQAVAHLLWPCFHPTTSEAAATSVVPERRGNRPSRRRPVSFR